MRASLVGSLVALAGAVGTACSNAGQDRILGITAMGVVRGFVYFDRNGNRRYDPGIDATLGHVRVTLLPSGTIDTAARTASDTAGVLRFKSLPVDSYAVAVDSAAIGDSAQIVTLSPARFRLLPAETVFVTVAISFPRVTVAGARTLAVGKKAFVDGASLLPRPTFAGVFGDSTLHVADTSGALRATRVVSGPLIAPGDTIRLLGTRSARGGQPVLDSVTTFFLASGVPPTPTNVKTASAAAAGGGLLDAALVQVDSARITDTTTVSGGFLLTTTDGSGTLGVLLERAAGFVGSALAPYRPGVLIQAAGVLVPTGVGAWQLKPRSASDVTVL